MHVLIYDPIFVGHHLNWVKLLARASEPFADRITFATTRQAVASVEFAEHLRNPPANFHVDDSMPPLRFDGAPLEGMRLARKAWLGLLQAVRTHQPDHLFVPYGDIFTRAFFTRLPGTLNLPMPASQVDAIFLAGSFAYHRHLPMKRRLTSYMQLTGLRALPFGRLLFIDPIAHDWLHEHCPGLARRCALSPDPVNPVAVHSKSAARSKLNLPQDGRLVSCVGVLDHRKGIDEFTRSFAAAGLSSNDRLLLAGQSSADVKAARDEAIAQIGSERIISLDRMLSHDELDLAVSAADLVAVVHRFPGHIGSATVLIRAAAAGRPVLASEQGWPGHVTRQFSLGWIYPENQAQRRQSIAASLEKAADYVADARASEFANFHSAEQFGNVLTAPLRQRREAWKAPAA
jgi:glycosyltransferase involved in cell wall biosynthesis